MKKLLIYCIPISFLLLFGCTKLDEEFLDKTPHTSSDYDFYRTPSGALQGLTAAYHILGRGEDVERAEFAGTVCSGDAMAGGEPGGNDQADMQEMMQFLTVTNNTYVRNLWSFYYRGVYRCNMIIGYLSESVEGFPEEDRIQILGEAYFLRGLFHFKLQVLYGGMPQLQSDFNNELKGVPFNDHTLKQDEWYPTRPTLDYTWGKIEEDFISAADMIKEKSQQSSEEIGRATRGAALSMLAKTYLYQEKWQDAYNAAKEVINSGEYWLEGDNEHSGPYTVTRFVDGVETSVEMSAYKWICQPEANNSGGSIFSVQHYQENSNLFPQGQQGNLIPRYYGPRALIDYINVSFPDRIDGTTDTVLSNSGEVFWGFILPTDYFVETAYEDIGCEIDGEIIDPRYYLSVIEDEDPVPTGNLEITHTFSYEINPTEENPSGLVEWDSTVVWTPGDSLAYSGWYNWPCTGRSTWKYFTDPYWNETRTTLGDMPQNTRYLRYADLLLMGAEAAVHIGQNADALAWVNKVRERARNSGNTGYPQALSSVTVEDIWAERRVELAFEGHQFYDIVRTGRAQQVLKEDAMQYPESVDPNSGRTARQQFGDNFIIGKNEILPIPQAEIDNTEGSIEQNPNW